LGREYNQSNKNLEYDKFFDTEIVLQQGEFEKEYKNIIKQIQQKYNEAKASTITILKLGMRGFEFRVCMYFLIYSV
jgi:hypoxanthine-guanine phosphoribosyltransferase